MIVEIEKRVGGQLQLSVRKKRLPWTHRINKKDKYWVLLAVEANGEKQ